MSGNGTTTKKHSGSCHCGAVKIEAELDASAGTRCNCTICTKLGCIATTMKPDAFRLLAGEGALASYAMSPAAARFFCKHCGIFVYGKGHVAELGGDFVSVNLNVLDDVDPGLLSVRYWDGRHDNWQAGPRDRAWPIAGRS